MLSKEATPITSSPRPGAPSEKAPLAALLPAGHHHAPPDQAVRDYGGGVLGPLEGCAQTHVHHVHTVAASHLEGGNNHI